MIGMSLLCLAFSEVTFIPLMGLINNIVMNYTFLAFLGGQELIVIAFIVLLLFGGKKLPELMKGLGKGIREFNNAKANIQGEIKDSMKEIDDMK
jgi:sec-independent protein translocase protein TatA